MLNTKQVELTNEARMIFLKTATPEQVEARMSYRADHGECCPAGTDTRKRLYFKFTDKEYEKNLVMWYCHNCGEGGAFKIEAKFSRTSGTVPVVAPKTNTYIEEVWQRSVQLSPTMVVSDNDRLQLPEHHEKYLIRSGWLAVHRYAELAGNYVRYDPYEDELVFLLRPPGDVHNRNIPLTSEKTAIQLRPNKPGKPKCMTVKGTPDAMVKSMVYPRNLTDNSDPIIVVEDMMSAIKVAYSGFMAFVLCGSHLSSAEYMAFSNLRHHPMVVWLDNDNPQVYKSAEYIFRLHTTLSGLPNPGRVVSSRSDPKHFNVEEIQDIIQYERD